MTLPAVVCYGEVGVDNIIQVPHLPSPERAAFPTADHYQIGGAAANTAIWLAGWGVTVRLLGNALGDDDQGRRLLGWLKAFPSLDLQGLAIDPGAATPFCRILVTPDAERTILVFGYPEAAKTELRSEHLRDAAYAALDLYGGDERLAAAQAARAAGVPTVINDVVDPDHPALPLTSIAVNSAAYIRSLYPGVDPIEHARRLQTLSGGTVVTTDGADPIHVLGADGTAIRLRPPTVEARDATGAGDAFRAGLIYGLLQSWPLAKSAAFAAAAGALRVSQSEDPGNVPAATEVHTLAAGVQVRGAS